MKHHENHKYHNDHKVHHDHKHLMMIIGIMFFITSSFAENILTSHLKLEKSWLLDGAKGRFDASGIERGNKGELLIVRDIELAIYKIKFDENSNVASLIPHEQYATQKKNMRLGVKRFDIEGLAIDHNGILHACDEFDRRVIRFTNPDLIELLPLDFSDASTFFSKDSNASFEGIAIGNNRLYLANERSQGRLLELDLKTGRMISSFVCRPEFSIFPDVHYSGLDWHKGKLFALLREERAILEIDPKHKSITRIIRYHEIEHLPNHRYHTLIPFSGVMEGLLVEDEVVWLLTDNNGKGRIADPSDTRPSLFRCRIIN